MLPDIHGVHRRARKGQIALEYITTYGWAFVVMLLTLAALAYFGVFNPSTYLPAKCDFPQEFQCTDYVTASSGAVKFVLVNGYGRTMNISAMTVWTQNFGSTNCVALGFPLSVSANQKININCTLPQVIPMSKTDIFVNFTYERSDGNRLHMMRGEIYTSPSS
jgi:hypothetical protein